jgi:hypothetical protein
MHQSLRQRILAEVCQANEQDIVKDGIDVQTAEIRRKIKSSEIARVEILSKMSDVQQEILRATSLTVETVNSVRNKLETQLDEKLQLQKSIQKSRTAARLLVEECQRLLEDLEERHVLEAYAKNNGLVLEGNSTDELIRVCRTHQEKIIAKNAAVDGSRRIPPQSLGGDEEGAEQDEQENNSSDDDESFSR